MLNHSTQTASHTDLIFCCCYLPFKIKHFNYVFFFFKLFKRRCGWSTGQQSPVSKVQALCTLNETWIRLAKMPLSKAWQRYHTHRKVWKSMCYEANETGGCTVCTHSLQVPPATPTHCWCCKKGRISTKTREKRDESRRKACLVKMVFYWTLPAPCKWWSVKSNSVLKVDQHLHLRQYHLFIYFMEGACVGLNHKFSGQPLYICSNGECHQATTSRAQQETSQLPSVPPLFLFSLFHSIDKRDNEWHAYSFSFLFFFPPLWVFLATVLWSLSPTVGLRACGKQRAEERDRWKACYVIAEL